MAYLGRYTLGQEVPIQVETVDGAGLPTTPVDAPRADVWSATTKIETVRVPIIDKSLGTTRFATLLLLGSAYSTGHFQVVKRWTIGLTQFTAIDTFEIVAGGGEGGAVVSMVTYERPEAVYIVQHRQDGKIVRGRNPRL